MSRKSSASDCGDAKCAARAPSTGPRISITLCGLENTGNLREGKFNVHIIDRIRSPHSISVADLDGDGRMEVVVGEHDPFTPYRSKSRLYVYKQVDAKGTAWSRFPLDNRFEHHDGAKAVELSPGRLAIISHGWMEPGYVHVWERRKP